MIQVDISGHSPIPFGSALSVLSVFKLQHNLLFLAVFRVLNFRSCFEALNSVFWENWEQHGSMGPWTMLWMPKLRPGKLKHQFTETGPTVLALHLLGLGFWTFHFFHCFSIINRPSSLIVVEY